MPLKARCPKNPDHRRFIATATVLEEWVVDENGTFIAISDQGREVIEPEMDQQPWSCQTCGADAIFIDE